jgi:hypothetical protein
VNTITSNTSVALLIQTWRQASSLPRFSPRWNCVAVNNKMARSFYGNLPMKTSRWTWNPPSRSSDPLLKISPNLPVTLQETAGHTDACTASVDRLSWCWHHRWGSLLLSPDTGRLLVACCDTEPSFKMLELLRPCSSRHGLILSLWSDGVYVDERY